MYIMGNTHPTQGTGKNVDVQKNCINCPLGQTTVCSPNTNASSNTNSYGSVDVSMKQGFESFESVAINDFMKAHPTLSFVLFIILLAFIVFFARSASLASLS